MSFTVRQMDFLAAHSRMERLRSRLGVLEPEGQGPRSAGEIAATLTPENLNSLQESNEELQASIGLQLSSGPRLVISTVAHSKQQGQAREVQEALENREQEVRLQSQRKSLAQVQQAFGRGTLLRLKC